LKALDLPKVGATFLHLRHLLLNGLDSIVGNNTPGTALGVGMAAFDRPSRKTIGGLTEAGINAEVPPTRQQPGLGRASLKLGSPSTYVSSDSTVRYAGAQQCWHLPNGYLRVSASGKARATSLSF
jgi:hypothetical protein